MNTQNTPVEALGFKVVSDHEVLHRVGTQGERVGRIMTVQRPDGSLNEVRFVYSYSNGTVKLVRVI
jgi:hypothetical protein